MSADEETVIANEFAHVTVRKIETAEGQWIEISAPKRERAVRLDVAMLWRLAGEPMETFTALLSDAPLGFKES